jgi:hypothetical protein
MDSGMFKLVLYKRYFFTLSGCGAVIKGYYLILKNLQKNNRIAQNNHGKHIVSCKSFFRGNLPGRNSTPVHDYSDDFGSPVLGPASGMPAGSSFIYIRSPITHCIPQWERIRQDRHQSGMLTMA